MAYVKQTFVDGTTELNAEVFNHMEDGIAANDTANTALSTRVTTAEDTLSEVSGESPNLFYPGVGDEWTNGHRNVHATPDADGTTITFSGTANTSQSAALFSLLGESVYTTANLPAGTYYFGEEQVTGEHRLKLRLGTSTEAGGKVITTTETLRVYLRTKETGVNFDGCSARYWIVASDHPVPFFPHTPKTATDIVARAEALDAGKTAAANLATIEGDTASTNYAIDDLLTYQGKLYKAKTAITTGATLKIGTNIEETTIAEQLTALKNMINT